MAISGILTSQNHYNQRASGTWPTSVTVPSSYFIGLLSSSSTSTEWPGSIVTDSSGNVYINGYTNASGTYVGYIAKLSSAGAITWQKTISSIQYNDLAIDSSGNLYGCGGPQFSVTKHDSSGNLLWQRRAVESNYGSSVRRLVVDTSGNVIVCGYADIFGRGNEMYLIKYDTSGTLQWQRQLGIATNSLDDYGLGLCVDSSGNSFMVGESSNASGDGILAKFDSSGTIQWQKRFGSTGYQASHDVVVDTSGNLFVACFDDTGSGYDAILTKFDSTGTMLWSNKLGGSGTSEFARTLAVDSTGNVYLNSSGGDGMIIAKYNTGGALQWQRSLGATTAAQEDALSLFIDASDNLYFATFSDIRGAGNYDTFFGKLPTDGSKTGTYTIGANTVYYTTSTLTNVSSSFTSSTSSLTFSAGSLTSSTTSETTGNANLTSTIVTL